MFRIVVISRENIGTLFPLLNFLRLTLHKIVCGWGSLRWSSHSPGKLLEFYVRRGIFGMLKVDLCWFWHCNGYIVYKLIHVTKEWMVNISDECLVFYIFRLRTMIESTWKILKLDWKTLDIFYSKRVGTPPAHRWGSSPWTPCSAYFWAFPMFLFYEMTT